MDTKDENKNESNVSDAVIEDTEAGLDLPESVPETTDYVDEEEQLRIEFQNSVEKAAEERASTPFQVAAMTHARLCKPAMDEIDNISGGAAKRILKYLIAYPFYVKELNAQDKQVEAVAQVCDKLVQTKFTMAMCQAMEKEVRVAAAIAEQEALIAEVPDDVPVAGLKQVMEDNKELLNDLAELEEQEKKDEQE